jgi:hypothetical protein
MITSIARHRLKSGTCERCGEGFVYRASRLQRFCSVQCRGMSEACTSARREVQNAASEARMIGRTCPLNWRTCRSCGVEWLAAYGERYAFCSSECKTLAKQQRSLAWYYQVGKPRDGYGSRALTCAGCGAEFIGHGGRAYCDSCPDVRSMVYRQAPEPIRLSAIADRDKHQCWLCQRNVKQGEASIDHVIPIARGGKHILSNVRLAHRSCNSRKGARLVEAQVGLL